MRRRRANGDIGAQQPQGDIYLRRPVGGIPSRRERVRLLARIHERCVSSRRYLPPAVCGGQLRSCVPVLCPGASPESDRSFVVSSRGLETGGDGHRDRRRSRIDILSSRKSVREKDDPVPGRRPGRDGREFTDRKRAVPVTGEIRISRYHGLSPIGLCRFKQAGSGRRLYEKHFYRDGRGGPGPGDTVRPHGRGGLGSRDKGFEQNDVGGRHVRLFVFQREGFEVTRARFSP